METLKLIENQRPGTLKKLEAQKASTRRIVASRPDLLFERPDLVRKYSAELMPGWFVGTNNSSRDVEKYLRKAAQLADLAWGRDIFVKSLPIFI
jgi:hypothetical protein